jgi:hypothetical protein
MGVIKNNCKFFFETTGSHLFSVRETAATILEQIPGTNKKNEENNQAGDQTR